MLRQRLVLTGDLTGDTASDRFDAELTRAVKRFQGRHGLTQDGVVGSKTRGALDLPVEARIEQIVLNLERWRWMPRQLGRRYILVNMAGFELQAIEDGFCNLQNNVLAGNYDNGDCCPHTGITKKYPSLFTYPCVEYYRRVHECVKLNISIDNCNCNETDPYFREQKALPGPSCKGDMSFLGDDNCNIDLNNEECFYDSGDCCKYLFSMSVNRCALDGDENCLCKDPKYDSLPPPLSPLRCGKLW